MRRGARERKGGSGTPSRRTVRSSERQARPVTVPRGADADPKASDGGAAGWRAAADAETQRRLDEWLAPSKLPPRAAGPIDPTIGMALDPWQKTAVDALRAGRSVVVDAPTTAGKTRVIEAFFRANLGRSDFRAVYTTPVKSLSNDKVREFRQMFGEANVGICTGDVKERLDAPIVVATLESYRNSLLGVAPDLGRTIAIFDEYHYLQDEARGSAWEEALILTPSSCNVLLLSASVANAEQFCAWLESLGHAQCELVRTTVRPVPLVSIVYAGGGWVGAETLPAQVLRDAHGANDPRPLRHEELAQRLGKLEAMRLTPCIIYAGRRLACEILAQTLARQLEPLPEAAAAAIGASLTRSHQELKALTFITPDLRRMLQVYGVGYHHSGLAAPARMAIEALVKEGLLRFCSATMGLSLGINFSVRSTLISDFARPSESGFVDYEASEVLQMLGRAGRRGKDAVGFSLWPTPESYARFHGAHREPARSRLRRDPTTFLGLIGRGFDLEAIERFYTRSFRRFTDANSDFTLARAGWLAPKLKATTLPCASPASAYVRAKAEAAGHPLGGASPSPCPSCTHRPKCHPILEGREQAALSALHLHLHAIGALEEDEQLTRFGSIARFFPQAGGLYLARLIASGELTSDRVAEAAELAGVLALARHKEPGWDGRVRIPFGGEAVEAELGRLYPEALFPELYQEPFGNGERRGPALREFHPAGAHIVRAWLQGMPWRELVEKTTTETFAVGDLMSLIYRVGTYLQAIAQCGVGNLGTVALAVRDALLREPLALVLGG